MPLDAPSDSMTRISSSSIDYHVRAQCHESCGATFAPTAPAHPPALYTKSAFAHFAPGPSGWCSLSLTSTLRPSGRCRQLRFASSSSRPERLHSYLAGPPDPRPSAPAFKPFRRYAPNRLQVRRIHPSHPRSVPRKKGFSSGASPPENPFIRSSSRAVFATLTSVRPTLPRPRRGQASRQVCFFRYAPERDLSRVLLAGGRSVPVFHRTSCSSRPAPP